MEFFRETAPSRPWMATLAIGTDHLENFKRFSLPFILNYCDRFDLNLVCFDDDIVDLNSGYGRKKKNWQKLLIPMQLKETYDSADKVCYFDSDILFNPNGNNIFDYHLKGCFSVVSEVKNLPYDDYTSKKILSFERNRNYSSNYPLDSALFMKAEEIYRFHGFPVYDDYACSGLFVCDVKAHSAGLSDIFYSYGDDVDSITGGGDEPAFNYEIRNRFSLNDLPYEFQAIWPLEMSSKYRHLFQIKTGSTEDSANCIASCLSSVTALHFAGSWQESKLYMDERIFKKVCNKNSSDFLKHLLKPALGKSAGRILPD